MKSNRSHRINRRRFIKQTVNSTALAALSGTLAGTTGGCESKAATDYDVIIKGGTVYDGTMANPVKVDIGIKADKIEAIGQITGQAGKTLNAEGLAVVPGLIDVHTHCDLTFQRTGMKRMLAYFMPSWKGNHNYLFQGVTTVVTGNCGYGYADLNEWFDLVDTVGFGTNVYHLAPHGMIREELFGDKQPGELSSSQMAAMKKRVAEEMEKGAIGLSTGLEYAPGLLSTTQELIELSKVTRSYGRLYTTHLRNESAMLDAAGVTGVEKAIAEAIEICKRAEIPVEISHLKLTAPINGRTAALVLNPIAAARQEGLPITADQYPYAAGSTIISVLLPDRFQTSNGVKEEYKNKAGRAEIEQAITQFFSLLAPEKILITMYPEQEAYEGKTLQQIAELEKRSPAETYTAMVCEDTAPVGVFFDQEIAVVRGIMPNDFIITASDGWTIPKNMTNPHPRTYGTFPRKIRQFVLEEKLLPFQLALRSMTSLPAEVFGMKGRGKIAIGNYADIAVLDLSTLRDHATYLQPHQYCDGVTHLLVNGQVSIQDGIATGERGGKALRAG